jgi:hypothetical protein
MHRFPIPPKPDQFDKKVEKARLAVQKNIDDKQPPDFREIWGQFKDQMSAAQHRKCGFCEAQVVGTSFGDVEHFHPKSEIEALLDDEKTWGKERPNLATVEGRTPQSVSASGYWYYAYSWENYLLACTVCNQQWKMAIFPVQENPRGLPPLEATVETPLLLNPFTGPHPKDHLKFGRIGEVKPLNNSRWGYETIRTCGLDRPSLREYRLRVARRTYQRIDDLKKIEGTELDRVLKDIYDDGEEGAPHCGMVRAIYEQETGVTWEQLEALVKA